jgi:hypothetical protein
MPWFGPALIAILTALTSAFSVASGVIVHAWALRSASALPTAPPGP